MSDEKKFSVGTPCDLNSVKELVKELNEAPYELYFSAKNDFFGSSRHDIPNADNNTIAEVINFLSEKSIHSNVLLNAACFGNKQFKKNFLSSLEDYLDLLKKNKVKYLTIADPFLIEFILNNFDFFEIVVSSVANVRRFNTINYFDDLGVSRIIVSPDKNQDLDFLEKANKEYTADIEVILNEGCISECPFKQYHHRSTAHKNLNNTENYDYINNYIDFCSGMCRERPNIIEDIPVISPNDISLYKKKGLNYFKVAGRNMRLEWIIKTFNRYVDRNFEGNLIELMNSKEFMADEFHLKNNGKYIKRTD